VQIKRDALHGLKLPFKIIFGKIGKLQVNVPWRSLSSSPVEIILEGLQLIVVPT